MRRILKATMVAAALLGFAAAIAAQMPEMPKPGPEMTSFKWMVGKWSVAETHEKTDWGPGGKGTGTMTVKEGPGGFSHVVTYQSQGPMGAYSGHGITAWDASAKNYTSVWADAMTPGIAKMTCAMEGKDFVCQGDAEFQGQKFKTRSRAMDPKASGWSEIFEHSTDGGTTWMKVMTLDLKPAK